MTAPQRFCEELEYSDLLDAASKEPAGSAARHMLVAAFAVSGYCTAPPTRTLKPFNPLELETFELVDEQRGFRWISEKARSVLATSMS